jgi:hypothetical protein
LPAIGSRPGRRLLAAAVGWARGIFTALRKRCGLDPDISRVTTRGLLFIVPPLVARAQEALRP